MAKCGDNISSTHAMVTIGEIQNVITVSYCMNCKKRYMIKPQDKKLSAKINKRDTLQPSHNLYYKYYGKMNVA